MMTMTDEQAAYLADHNLGVLATTKRDGSPQMSMVNYHWSEGRIFISVTSDRAKWKNVLRQRRVAFLIPDGHRQLVVYGEAEPIPAGPERDRRILGIRERMGNPLPADVTMERFSASLDRLNRVAIGITPERILSNE